ncbi:hypothetical protein [Gulosibacter hominis]|uniref:hypothetical protein n=1 Tax=Gulosibacter hominis TaxID=2770504 RepID=UPI00191911FC|nr:hypothetical protein [Gulosibacter hominis]
MALEVVSGDFQRLADALAEVAGVISGSVHVNSLPGEVSSGMPSSGSAGAAGSAAAKIKSAASALASAIDSDATAASLVDTTMQQTDAGNEASLKIEHQMRDYTYPGGGQ